VIVVATVLAQAALTVGADSTKIAGSSSWRPPAVKVPDKYKTPTFRPLRHDELDAANKIYGDLKKPRYLFPVAKMDKTFMPEKQAEPRLPGAEPLAGLPLRRPRRMEAYISGRQGAGQVQSGEYKVVKTTSNPLSAAGSGTSP